jgi:hypothetical protein
LDIARQEYEEYEDVEAEEMRARFFRVITLLETTVQRR